ncbi:glycoside hydrolase family 3 C-terminal domain-containing protein [Paenibacillus sp. P25]|nr:glycoside hydrolase family 3 C-terminal domain-containing protein [Paenibacillus sp. P25]
MLENRTIRLEEAEGVLGSAEHTALSREIAARSITVLEADHLPIAPAAGRKVLLVATRSPDEGREVEDMGTRISGKAGYLLRSRRRYGAAADLLVIDEYPDERDVAAVTEAVRKVAYDHVIYAAFVRVISYKEGSGTLPSAQLDIIARIREMHPQLILLVLGGPYILRKMEAVGSCICAYGDGDESIDAAVDVLFGAEQARGRLPVEVNEKYRFGYGL